MKKLIAIFAVLLFAAPAMAADWSFYGSQRIATWYVDRDYGDAASQRPGRRPGHPMVLPGQLPPGRQGQGRQGQRPDRARSRDGRRRRGHRCRHPARLRRVEVLGQRMLKVGKDYSPVTDFISNQWFDADDDLLGEGNFYGRRPAGLTLGHRGLRAGLPGHRPTAPTSAPPPTASTAPPAATPTPTFPRLEASYMLKLGSGYIKPFGGFQYLHG